MWIKKAWLPLLLIGTIFNCYSQARRIRVQRPLQPEEAEESIQYYSAEPQEEDEDQRQRVVLVSSADQYNGLYGQPSASSRNAQVDNYIPRGPVKAREQQRVTSSREKEANKAPPVQTIRNYSKVNDDGSFTFGYEAADGSFKEETRGTDCVVRGKYGYVDPDGNKREFTYVSGNPCDPNAPKEDEEDELPEDESNENVPQNYPVRPVRPILRQPVPVSTPKPVTLFQQAYEQSEEEQPEPEQVLRATPTPAVRQPTYSVRPQYIQSSAAQADQVYSRPRLQPTTPSSVYRQSIQPVTITPRPQPTQATRNQLPATTYRPQLLQVAVTPRPALLYTPKPSPSYAPSKQLDFDAEFQKFQQDNLISQTPKSTRPDSNQVYSSALLFDPATGQYKNQLYQTLSQTDGDFSFSQSIQPYVAQQNYQRPALQQIAAPQRAPQPQRTASQYATPRPLLNNQAAYQAQQAEQLFQNSAQLYAQQQKVREQQQQQSQRAATQSQAPVYYIQPSIDQTGALGASQIDAFLRGHNIQF